MKNSTIIAALAGILFLGSIQAANALPVALIEQGSSWEYEILTVDLWTDWNAADYSSYDWSFDSSSTGNAAFGNRSGQYATYWEAASDLALQQTFTIDGILDTPITLNVASDNGFIVFINGHEVAKDNAEGYTSYWEYSFSLPTLSFLSPGLNTIQVLAEDHGGATFFDLQLTGNVSTVPEPATLALFTVGLVGLAGFKRKKSQ